MRGLQEQANKYGATQQNFSMIEREISRSQAKIAQLQAKYSVEGQRINKNLQQLQQTNNSLKHEYMLEQSKVSQTGRPSTKLQNIGNKIHTNMLKYNELRKGTERYFKLRYELQNEQTQYNNLLNKYRLMQRQYQR